MADNSNIEWCHATVNAISGCTPISPGCANCFAMRAGGMGRPHHPSNGLTQESKAGHVWTGAVRLNETWLRRPLSWRRPRRIFWNAHGDAWHESVPVEWIDRELAVAALTLQHIHLFLTKRSTHMRRYFEDPATPERVLDQCRYLGGLPTRWQWPLPNVWLGVSVEDQTRADERREDFRATPGAVKFVSYEPALGPVDWEGWDFVHQIIGGGESGPNARPMHPDWQRATRDWCAPRGIAYFFKQWGEWSPYVRNSWANIKVIDQDGRCQSPDLFDSALARQFKLASLTRVGKKAAGRLLDGVEHNAIPTGINLPAVQFTKLTESFGLGGAA
ncbi:MAG: phage Gp37/Gp68 family protein [Methylovirgula sp.]|nr:phage Gp37/Gp68 family protein [Methylovirgula sp.]